MEKYFNWVSVAAGVTGGFLAKVFGGWDALLVSFLVMMVLDYLTGVLKACASHRLSSEIGFKGICKKFMMALVIAFSCILQKVIGSSIPLREITICFFSANEGLSILENAAVLVPVPQKLRDVLLQLREDNETEQKGDGKKSA